jgi:murein DD-endopeptidase MepM/ murein hydrolase activator NlpD
MKAPIKGFSLARYNKGSMTQYFAENPKLYAHMNMHGHNGVDIVAPHGTPMYAVESGTVVEVKNTPEGYGKHLRFITHGKNGDTCREWTYGHCSNIHVQVGDEVTEGDHVADMGNTGFVVSGATPFWNANPFAGTHLHLGLREVKRTRVNSWSYPNSKIQIQVRNYDNGFKGSIDPAPLLQEVSDDNAERQRLLTIISLLNKVVELYKQLNILK